MNWVERGFAGCIFLLVLSLFIVLLPFACVIAILVAKDNPPLVYTGNKEDRPIPQFR